MRVNEPDIIAFAGPDLAILRVQVRHFGKILKLNKDYQRVFDSSDEGSNRPSEVWVLAVV